MKLAARRPVRAMAATKAKAKRLATKAPDPPQIMTDKEVKKAKAELMLRGFKPEIEGNPKAKGDMVKGKGGKGGKGGGKGGQWGQRQGQGNQAPRSAETQAHGT